MENFTFATISFSGVLSIALALLIYFSYIFAKKHFSAMNFEIFEVVVEIGVAAAEQFYKIGDLEGSERKDYVVSFVNKELERLGIVVDVETIITYIEAKVFNL